ncbi:homeodomain-like, Zinc finger, RING/FYVE/PHD-type [Artemisia annua]|uniref:Homeodomain-like, Zinc finger, RING/FYVE/PHD-type n=1 Tax=Artemisia annua TaxID=35608 RepID=A0A2U1KA58_ARTAN|nr:homeodomain-like, Zinc finger, RING/FYVE/PHD-type [Artemisia annua]
MAVQPPNVSWALAIEALAYSQEVDVNTLIDTFNSCPKFTSDVGSNAREMVSFRILERLFDPDTRRSKSVGRKSGVSFDFSKRCEDVLEHILRETPEPNTWNESELSKWHVQPFIAYKRSCLPKPALQRLKDALLEGTPTFLKSFHQLVTSLQLNQHRTKAHEVNGASTNNDNETYSHLNQHGTKTHEVNDATFTNEKESPGTTNDNVCQDTSNEGNKRGEDGDYVEQNSESRPSNDDELYHKELNDILAKKQEFFSSICEVRERGTHSKKENRCMKCNKGGELLVCSSNNCSFVFHNSCLASKSSFDYEPTGKFYCPFCRYSQVLSDYWAAEKKASLARNKLVSFNRSTLNHMPKTSLDESKIPNEVSDPDLTILIDESPERNGGKESKKEDYVDCVVGFRKLTKPPNGVSNLEINEEGSESSDGKGCNEENIKEVYVDRAVGPGKPTKPPNGVSSHDLVSERSESSMDIGCSKGTNKENAYVDCVVRLRERTKPTNGVSRPDLISKCSESSGVNGCSDGTKKENAYVDRTVRLRDRTKQPNGVSNFKLYDESSESSDGKGCREGSNKEENSVGHTVRPRKRTLPSPSLQVPQRRRVPVPWTQSEEDTLKKWVAKFTSDSNILGRGFPWSRILDLGASKFQSSRTPVDLKDKWRNMQKASKKSK